MRRIILFLIIFLVCASSAAAAAPQNISLPYIQGLAYAGNTLQCNAGAWSTPAGLTYTWENESFVHKGAGQTYSILASDIGHVIRCKVTVQNADGSAQATTSYTGLIQQPTIATPDIVEESGQLKCQSQGSALIFVYQWHVNLQLVHIGPTFDPSTTLAGAAVSCTQIWNTSALTSAPYHNASLRHGEIIPPTSVLQTQSPEGYGTLSGTPVVGQTLRCQTGRVDSRSVVSYRWLKNGTLSFQQGQRYKISRPDTGQIITCLMNVQTGSVSQVLLGYSTTPIKAHLRGYHLSQISRGGSSIPLARCTIIGTARADVLRGTSANDIICGLGGADTIIAGSGNDIIDSGSGSDTINAGAGDDIIYAGSGNDTIIAGLGNDKIGSGLGDDIVHGGAGSDFIHAGAGRDRILAGSGGDLVRAAAGNDYLDGQGGDDYLSAGSGNDVLSSGAGNDFNWADNGRDIIRAGAGNDYLHTGIGSTKALGGAGRDTFISLKGDHHLLGQMGVDEFTVLANRARVDAHGSESVRSMSLGFVTN